MYHVKHCCTAPEHFVRERDAFINISDGFAPLWNQLDVWRIIDLPAKIPKPGGLAGMGSDPTGSDPALPGLRS
jgi:hypothetical protein